MGTLFAVEYLSLDGVMEEPRWSGPWFDDEVARFQFDNLIESDSLLLGRVTYEGFKRQAWPSMTDAQGFADRMNEIPKHVASRTLGQDDLAWTGSTLLPAADAIGAVRELRATEGNGLQVWGSASLAAQLIAHDLVDEYVVMIEPVLVGGGKRIFPDDGQARPMELVKAITTGTGVQVCTYRPAR